MKHTKGPWIADYDTIKCDHMRTEYKSSNIVAAVWDCTPASLANAKLIAAAPEMLEALTILFYNVRLEISPELKDQILNVIKKAKGESL